MDKLLTALIKVCERRLERWQNPLVSALVRVPALASLLVSVSTRVLCGTAVPVTVLATAAAFPKLNKLLAQHCSCSLPVLQNTGLTQ
ncbi:hypothetical protein RvY_18308 [Ramazzottius varieornatus]|uniref:Uncharacterized protein n=1 Tax=Ramazzottius varieornatus TaxID=947166 RepID=A0A1D1W5S9_RAMVA|nr:hypothetical protein RvY_18308 [Ramazzottius varieornatus]